MSSPASSRGCRADRHTRHYFPRKVAKAVSIRKAAAIVAALLAVGLGTAACGDHAATPTPSGASQELNDIQTTLDAIDSEVASDGSG